LVGQVALKLLNAALELRTLIAEIDSDLTLHVLDKRLNALLNRFPKSGKI